MSTTTLRVTLCCHPPPIRPQNQALQKQVWALTEQHSRQVEELQAELKQKGVQIKELQAAKTDAARKVDEMSDKVKQVGKLHWE